MHIADGRAQVRPPLVLGHEVAWTCEEFGEVLVYAAWGCGNCRFCVAGEEQLCPAPAEAGWARDGGLPKCRESRPNVIAFRSTGSIPYPPRRSRRRALRA